MTIEQLFFELIRIAIGTETCLSRQPFATEWQMLYEMAKKIVFERHSASASYLQRRLKIGYNRAARIVEMMEEDGIVGPANGSKPREVIRYE